MCICFSRRPICIHVSPCAALCYLRAELSWVSWSETCMCWNMCICMLFHIGVGRGVLMFVPRIGGWSVVLCVGWYGRGIVGLVWGGVWAGASVKSQRLPPTDSNKDSVTASAVGTSNEPSTAFNIPRPFSASVCIWVISMGYCIYVCILCWVHMCVYSTQWTCQRGAYPMSSDNINPSHFFKSQLQRPISNCQPPPAPSFFSTQATWDFMISS